MDNRTLNAEMERLGDVEITVNQHICNGQGTKFDVYTYDPEPADVRSDDTTLPYELAFEAI